MKIAVVGGGIVGATCAYYLSKEQKNEIVVFDYGVGQATKASAGIITDDRRFRDNLKRRGSKNHS